VGNWRGALWHKNLLGREMALATTLTLASAAVAPRRQRRALLVIAGLDGDLLVIGARSVTGIVLMVAGVATVVLAALPAVNARERLGRTVLWVTAVVAGLAVIWAFGVVALDGLGRDLTLTGRDRVWEVTVRRPARPCLDGHGFGAFWERARWGRGQSRARLPDGPRSQWPAAGRLVGGDPGGGARGDALPGSALARRPRAGALAGASGVLGFLVHFALLGVSDAVMSGPNSLSLTFTVAILLSSPKAQGEVAAAPTPRRATWLPGRCA
jgi:hypothetical protein